MNDKRAADTIDALEQRLREEEQRREEAIENWQTWEERALAAEAEVENLKGDLEATDAALAQERADFAYVVRRAEAAEAALDGERAAKALWIQRAFAAEDRASLASQPVTDP